MTRARDLTVRRTREDDFPGIVRLCEAVYPGSPPWQLHQLRSHLTVFPAGQLVAVESDVTVVGMAASLIVLWDDYEPEASWQDFTDGGMFTNHDPEHGRTLYGAEIMVSPDRQGTGVGSLLYEARRNIVRDHALLRIRAGARLRGYHRYSDRLTAGQYVQRVVRGEIHDPTLSFQLHRGFHAIAVVSRYLRHDPESLGYAAVIEWLNPDVATESDFDAQRRRENSLGTMQG